MKTLKQLFTFVLGLAFSLLIFLNMAVLYIWNFKWAWKTLGELLTGN